MWSGTTGSLRITTTSSSNDHVQQKSDSNPMIRSRMNHNHHNHNSNNHNDDDDILLYNQQQQQQHQQEHQQQEYQHQDQNYYQQQKHQHPKDENVEESSSSIEELFSQCIPNLLMNIEELRQYYIMIVQSQSQQSQQQQQVSSSSNNRSSSTDTNINIIVTIEVLQELHHRMNSIIHIIHQLQYYYNQMYNTNINNNKLKQSNTDYMNHILLYQHVLQKSLDIIQPIIHTCCLYYIEPIIDTNTENDTNDNSNNDNNMNGTRGDDRNHNNITTLSIEEQRRIGQGYIARIIEIHIIINYMLQQQQSQQSQHVDNTKETTLNTNNINNNNTYYDDIIQLYTHYQKRTLRIRCKPCIAQLVNIRKQQLQLQLQQQNQNQNSIWNPMNTTYINQLINTASNHHGHNVNIHKNINTNDVPVDEDDDDNDDIPAVVVDISNLKNTSDSNSNTILTTNTLLAPLSVSSLSSISSYEQYHAPVFTVILGTAITLIHPLYSWMNQLSISIEQEKQEQNNHHHHHHQSTILNNILYNLCHSSIIVLMEQTQILIRTIYDWFYIDRKIIIDYYNNNNQIMNTNSNNHNNNHNIHHQIRLLQLGQLNSMVDEMAYIAQILQRYQTFIHEFDFVDTTNHNNHNNNNNNHTSINNDNSTTNSNNELNNNNNNNIITNEILPEWIWQYSTYERILVLQQWQISISRSSTSTNGTNPTPVCIVIGTKIRVSSCIEDAQYISNRAIDRSISTQSIYAIANVVYTIVHDLWSTDEMNNNNHHHHTTPSPSSKNKTNHSSTTSAPTDDGATTTVYQALIDEIGCWNETDDDDTTNDNQDTNTKNSIKSNTGPASGNSNDFAAALLDALDDDLGDNNNNNNNQLSATGNQSNKTPMKAPSSGGFLLSSLISSNLSNDHDRYNEQRQLDTLFCVWNSLYAASEACRTLANTLDDILIDYVDDNNNHIDETTTTLDNKSANATTKSPDLGVIKTSSSSSSPTKDSMTTKAMSKIQVTRDDVIQYSNDYQKLLTNRIDTSINMWCNNNSNNQYSNSNGTNMNNCLGQLYDFFHNESYNIDGNTLNKMEQDERLINAMIQPFQQSKLLQQFTNKCDIPILHIVAERLATIVVDMILNMLWNKPSNNDTIPDGINDTVSSDNHHNSPMKGKPKPNKRFTDWGALLLSKQSRMLQQYISSTMIQPLSSSSSTMTSTTIPPATKVIQIWERLSYVITVLQIEKPMDWITYYHTPTSSTTMSLTPDELYDTLQLRIDFSLDAIETVVSKIRSTS